MYRFFSRAIIFALFVLSTTLLHPMMGGGRRGFAFVELPVPLVMSSVVRAIKPEVEKKIW